MIGVDMNRTHIRVWLNENASIDFELPKGRRPKFWTILRAVPSKARRRRAHQGS